MIDDDFPAERYSWYCTECGENHTGTTEPFYAHECNIETLILYQKEQFQAQFATFMGSLEGKFARYLAQREVGNEHSMAQR